MKILQVEDNPGDARLIEEALREADATYEVTTVATLKEGITLLQRMEPDATLLDLGLPDSQGLDTLRRTLEVSPHHPVLVVTGLNDDAIGVLAVAEGAQDYLVKGQVEPLVLSRALRYAIERSNLVYEHERTWKALKESKALYEDLYENAPDMFISADAKTMRIKQCNLTLLRKLGYAKEEILGRLVTDLYHPDCREQARMISRSFLEAGEVDNAELELMRKDGSKIPVILNVRAIRDEEGKILHSRSSMRDISEWRATKNELAITRSMLIRSEKLAALGQLAAGVAHEIKNPLNIISTSIQLLTIEDDIPDDTMNVYNTVLNQVSRAVKITENLRDFARERKPEVKRVEVCELIRKTVALVEYEMKVENISISIKCATEGISILCDEDQMAQVFLNIIGNSRDSMNEFQSKLSRKELDYVNWTGELSLACYPDGKFCRIDISDTGTGMSKATLERIFDPFFTTKEEGKGTGLGLSIVSGIIENNGGNIDVRAVLGEGTLTTIWLPLDEGEAANE